MAVPTKLGDAVLFNHDTWHSSFNGSQKRRMFTLNCTRRPKSPADEQTFRKYLSIHSAGAGNLITQRGMFYPPIVDTADAARWVHLEQASRVHDELFPHLSQAATEGKQPHDIIPAREVEAVRVEIEAEAARWPETMYRPWEQEGAADEGAGVAAAKL